MSDNITTITRCAYRAMRYYKIQFTVGNYLALCDRISRRMGLHVLGARIRKDLIGYRNKSLMRAADDGLRMTPVFCLGDIQEKTHRLGQARQKRLDAEFAQWLKLVDARNDVAEISASINRAKAHMKKARA